MIVKKTKVIYYLDGPSPTPADIAAVDRIAKYRTQVVFRNAQHVVLGEALETCDFVAGQVPALVLAALDSKGNPRFHHIDEGKPEVPVPAPGVVAVEPAPHAPAPEAPVVTAPAAPDAAEVEAWGNYSIKACVAMVTKKEISTERALALELAGKNRASLLKQLQA